MSADPDGQPELAVRTVLITGATSSLGLKISEEAEVFLTGDQEVGPVSIEGADTELPGAANGSVALLENELLIASVEHEQPNSHA